MNEDHLHNWLVENGGPAICYRTATELMADVACVETDVLKRNLLNCPMTRIWLSRVGNPEGLFSFHGSHPEAFENACFKLSDMGLQAGIPEFDKKTAAFRRDFAERSDFNGKFIVAGALTRAGYGAEPVLYDFLRNRLDKLYTMTKTKNYDIYIDQDTFSDFPSAFRKRRLLNPEYNGMLPSIYDMLALAYWPAPLMTDEIQHKINTVVAYVLNSDYQDFEDGYGVMRDAPRRYWSIGWSVHLPGYRGFDAMPDGRAKYFIQRLEMMARFPYAHDHLWFKQSLAHLQSFQQPDNTYRFPGRYLRETQQGYWVTGAYTRLDADRQSRKSLTVESTFRMLSIQRYVKTLQIISMPEER